MQNQQRYKLPNFFNFMYCIYIDFYILIICFRPYFSYSIHCNSSNMLIIAHNNVYFSFIYALFF